MAVTFQYRCGFTGLSLTGVVHRDASNDAAGTSLTFTENTNRLGVYTASATVTAGAAFVRITGDLVDGIDIIVPADGGSVVFGSNQSPIAVGSDGSVTSDASGATIVNSIPSAIARNATIPNFLTIITHTTWSQAITDLGDLAGVDDIWFTLKESLDDEDSESLLQVSREGGLLYAAGAVATDSGKGSVTVDSETDNNDGITIVVDETILALLEPTSDRNHPRHWDVKILDGSTTTQQTYGTAEVRRAVTRRNS